MAIQQAGKPSEQPRLRRFPRWLRPIFIVLGLVSLALLGFFWIRGVGSDLDKAMTALFVTLTAMFAFLAMPFLYHSEQSQPSNPPETHVSPSSPLQPTQITINNNNYAQQPSLSPVQATTSEDHQQSPISAIKPETPSQPRQQPVEYNSPSNFPAPGTLTPVTQIKLTNEERLKLTDALLEVYPQQEDFEMMLEVRCEKKLNTLVDGYSNYRMRIYHLLERTQAEGWTYNLIEAAHEERPHNTALQSWLQRYTAAREMPAATNSPTTHNTGPQLQNTKQSFPEVAEMSRSDQNITADQWQKPDVSSSSDTQKNQESQQTFPDNPSLERAFKSIREVYDEVQRIKVIFEGKGSIQQSDYSQATTTLRHVATCVQNLDAWLKSMAYLPANVSRVHLWMDLRHIDTYVKESIERIASYSTLNAHQQERNRKDVADRISTILTHLDELSRYLIKGPL